MSDQGQLVRAKALAVLFDLTERRIQQLAKDGIIPKAERGKYPLAASIKGYIAYLKRVAFDGEVAGESRGDYATERTRLLRANADKSELELKVMRQEYLPQQAVYHAWTKQIAAFRAKMLAIPVKMAAALHGIESKKEIEANSKGLIYEALHELAEDSGLQPDDIRPPAESGENRRTASGSRGR